MIGNFGTEVQTINDLPYIPTTPTKGENFPPKPDWVEGLISKGRGKNFFLSFGSR
jgi:hypothetical protein